MSGQILYLLKQYTIQINVCDWCIGLQINSFHRRDNRSTFFCATLVFTGKDFSLPIEYWDNIIRAARPAQCGVILQWQINPNLS